VKEKIQLKREGGKEGLKTVRWGNYGEDPCVFEEEAGDETYTPPL